MPPHTHHKNTCVNDTHSSHASGGALLARLLLYLFDMCLCLFGSSHSMNSFVQSSRHSRDTSYSNLTSSNTHSLTPPCAPPPPAHISLCITPLSSYSSLCQSQLRELRGLQLVPKERKNAVWVRSVNVKIKVNGKDCSGKSVKEMSSFVLGRCG
jgi:hypothetical protein